MYDDLRKNKKVVSFNIKFSRLIDHAVNELTEIDALSNADVVLLQEMDKEESDQSGRLVGQVHSGCIRLRDCRRQLQHLGKPERRRNRGNLVLCRLVWVSPGFAERLLGSGMAITGKP